MLSPWYKGQDSPLATDRAIWSFPATAVDPMMRMMYLDGLRVVSDASSGGLSGRRCNRTCGVGGRSGIGKSDIVAQYVIKIKNAQQQP